MRWERKTTMKCNCGFINQEGSKYCQHCGTKLRKRKVCSAETILVLQER